MEMDALLLHNEPLFPCVAETADLVNWSLAEVNSILFDMPTPPVSPSHADQQQQQQQSQSQHYHQHHHQDTVKTDLLAAVANEEELDLDLGDILSNIDLPEEALFDANDWFTDDNLLAGLQTTGAGEVVTSSPLDIPTAANGGDKCETSELRHDCMWAGHCPAEEHRYGCKKDTMLLPMLSSSPSETVLTMPAAEAPVVIKRTRLDTLGSIRPETPLSPSDSELETGGTSDNKSESSLSSAEDSDDGSDSDDHEASGHHHHHRTRLNNQYSLPPNIHPVRSAASRKTKLARTPIVPTVTSMIPDHSYSHSDHSYHTQRRPASSSSNENGADCLLTPSDSEEEIDVVSLGELCRITPGNNNKTSASAAATPVAQLVNTNGPIRLKLKVPAAATTTTTNAVTQNGQVLVRKALPTHPSAAVRQQLQLQLATAAQQRKLSDHVQQQHFAIGSTATATVKKALLHTTTTSSSSSCVESTTTTSTTTKRSSSSSSGHSTVGKRPRSSNGSNSEAPSPRKRCSRTASDSEDSCEKRSQHNSMERQRRVDLRNAFEFLRSLIPDLESTDRAAKVVILKKAAHFCQGLTQRERQHVAEKDALQKRQEMLKKRLALLQRRR